MSLSPQLPNLVVAALVAVVGRRRPMGPATMRDEPIELYRRWRAEGG